MPTIGNESSNVPKSLHMMQHIFRGNHHFDIVKSISNTDTALMLDQHKVNQCIEGIDCEKTFLVNPKIGHTHHYREICPGDRRSYGDKNCAKIKLKKNIVKDIGVWRHLETVVSNVNMALKEINFN